MDAFNAEGVRVTFFVNGKDLDDPDTDFANFCKETVKSGYQVFMHSQQ